jgi:type I restriction-modification system DNA methylase subunit
MEETQTLSEVVSVTPWSRQIYHDADDFWKESRGLHHAYIIYRTLRGDYKHIFKPNAVFYVGKSPAAYLKKVQTNEISDEDIRQWQRFLWNQTVVPMLIVKSPNKLNVYTAYTKPEEKDGQQRIQSILDDVANTLELDQIWTAIESGMIYEKNPDAFSRNQAVDQYLLRNLNSTALKLAKTQAATTEKEKEDNLIFAHRFLTRLLFVCYLIERGMVQGKKFEDENLKKIRPSTENQQGYFIRHLFEDIDDVNKKRDLLCKIFEYVKEKFNGSLFPQNVSNEKELYTADFIQTIDDFLQGHDTGTGQMVLKFWAYDFSVIPIETISAIYESFLGEQGKLQEAQGHGDPQRTTGAYYTPLHLAELTVDIALENTSKQIHELKILDPACGSGVFLVSLFGRIAESFYRKAKKTTGIEWARELKPKLNQLYGIDISDTACHITCFSLYLAYLEWLEPNDVEYLLEHGQRLPPLLANTKKESWNTIHQVNLFNPNLSLEKQDFDIVIGNPPWVSSSHQKDPYFLKWLSQKPQVRGPNKQIAHGFMWKAPEYLSECGIGCFLLPSAFLFNEGTNEFQKEWFNAVKVERVVNFSDLRFILFSGADHPCVAIRFSKSARTTGDTILYESPKTDILSQKGGPVYIREEDTINLQLKDILYAAGKGYAPVVWKSYFWGSWRDRRLLMRLFELPKLDDLAGEKRENKRWYKSQGFNSGLKSVHLKDTWWNNHYDFLDANHRYDLVISSNDVEPVGERFPLAQYLPPKSFFESPKVVVSVGSKDMKVAFCNFPVVFRHSIQAITGSPSDENLLRFLCVVIKSDIIQYYLFHTSANWGIERDKVHFHELLSIPFFLPEDASDPQLAQDIVDKAAGLIRDYEEKLESESWLGQEDRRNQKAKSIREKLEPLIRDYYNIDPYEIMLIEDTLQLAKESFHPKQNQKIIPTLREPNKVDCEIYTKTLCEMLNNFGKGSQFKVRGEIFKGMPYSVVHISLTDKISTSVPISDAKEKLESVIIKMEPLLQNNKGRFVFCQNLKVFDGNSLYILKPMQMRFWSRTAALNDADEIAGYIVQIRRGI